MLDNYNQIIKVEFKTGDTIYYLDGLVHNEHLPAIITNDGLLLFFKHGKLHNESGPAYFGPRGLVEYWLEDIQYNYEEWDSITNHSDHYP